MAVEPIPEGYHTVTPYIVAQGVPHLIDFLKQTFGGREVERLTRPDGSVVHAEVRIGDSIVMMGESTDDARSMPAMIYLYVQDVDATYDRALKAGAISVREPADQFYGDRTAGVSDRWSNIWYIATHKEDVPSEELQRRFLASTHP